MPLGNSDSGNAGMTSELVVYVHQKFRHYSVITKRHKSTLVICSTERLQCNCAVYATLVLATLQKSSRDICILPTPVIFAMRTCVENVVQRMYCTPLNVYAHNRGAGIHEFNND